jgi:hypothetical protein
MKNIIKMKKLKMVIYTPMGVVKTKTDSFTEEEEKKFIEFSKDMTSGKLNRVQVEDENGNINILPENLLLNSRIVIVYVNKQK